MSEDTGQRTSRRNSESSAYRGSDGQHYDRGSGAPGEARGQTGIIRPGVNVGNRSGGEQQMEVRGVSKRGDIATDTHEGSESAGERRAERTEGPQGERE